MKTIKQLLITVAVLLCSVTSNAYDFEVDGIYYNIISTENSEVEVTSEGDSGSSYGHKYTGSVEIPSSVSYNGKTYNVTSIGISAFNNCFDLTSITIPNSVKSIRMCAFYRCYKLANIAIPNSVTIIESNAFYDCGLTNIAIPNSVTSIVCDAFDECGGLTSIAVEDGNKKYDSRNNCNAIIETAKNKLVLGCKNTIIPNSVTSIGDYAFSGCSSLTNVTIPYGVTSIGRDAFSDCISLTSVTIPNSVTSIGSSAFEYCTALNTLIYHSPCSISSNIFTRCNNLSNIVYTSQVPPTSLWLATKTYVPNKDIYAKSIVSGGNGNFIDHVTFQNTYFTYGEIPQTEFVNNLEKFGYTTNAAFPKLPTNAGTHIIDIPFTLTRGDYQFNVNMPYKYTIDKAPLVAKVGSLSRLYGEKNPEFLISYSGFVNDENESVLTNKGIATTSATAKSDVGIYDIIISGITAGNYKIQYEKGSLKVNKASITVAADNVTKVYGDNNPKFTLKYLGLKNNETSPKMVSAINITTDATKLSNVGEYDITISGGEAKNYEITNYINGKLFVTKAPLTVIASNATKIYGEGNPEFKYSYSGAKNNDSKSAIFKTLPTISCVANEASKAGEYEIEIGNASSNNYEISYRKGLLIVNKRELLVSTKNYTRIYGEENPDFEISYNGFVNNDDESVLLIKPKVNIIADKDSNVGNYDITIEGGDDDNYSFAYNNGTLTIEKADQTITWEQEFDDMVVGSQIELTAKASSGLEIEYIIPDNNFLSAYTIGGSTYLDCYDVGEILVRATQNGNKNYNAAVRVSKVIKIVPTSINSVYANAIVKVDGNCVTVLGANNSSVAIYTTTGALVEKIDSYTGEEIMLDKGVYIVRVGNKTMKVKL